MSLLDEEGKKWFAEEDLGRMAVSHLKLLYTSEDIGVTLSSWNEILLIITEEHNAMVMEPISKDEVR